MAHTETETTTTVHEHAERKSVGENYFIGVILLLAAIAFYLFFAVPEFIGILQGVGLM